MQVIRRNTDHGIRLLLELAENAGSTTPCRQLAEACGTPRSFSYKILRQLAAQDLVVSQEGRPGGFRLNKAPARISLSQIVETLQGPISVSQCVVDSGYCDRRASCVLSKEWARLHQRMTIFLKRTTLEDLLKASTA